jgi:hypothetical protein
MNWIQLIGAVVGGGGVVKLFDWFIKYRSNEHTIVKDNYQTLFDEQQGQINDLKAEIRRIQLDNEKKIAKLEGRIEQLTFDNLQYKTIIMQNGLEHLLESQARKEKLVKSIPKKK